MVPTRSLEFSEIYSEKTKQRILKSIEKDKNSCWLWKKAKNNGKQSHGRIAVMNKGKRIHALTHRIAFHLWKGEIPKGLYVLHKCFNPNCCNPDHLEIGNQKDNCLDRKLAGNENWNPVKGVNHPHSKLNEEDVIEMRSLYNSGYNCGELSRKYGISKASIRDAVKFKTWRHI